MYIIHRPRRLRNNPLVRELCAETVVDKSKLIMPYFVLEGDKKRESIDSMPGIDRTTIDLLLEDIEKDYALGIKKILLFGLPSYKDDKASQAMDENGVIQKALRQIKMNFPDILTITDVCLCEYMDHGHCGIIQGNKILNDPTLELLANTALSHVRAGADMVAPSDMMDGRVAIIRDALDESGFEDIPIMSYSAKYASSFYGPFREAAKSSPQFGDRKSYQMDYRNAVEGEKEVMLDIEEGADIVMIKPALSYLDVVNRIKEFTHLPICVYNVSGEYSMVKASSKLGYSNEEAMVKEIITSFFRAGASLAISYHTRDIYKNNWF